MPENFLEKFATYFQKLDMFGFRIELSLQKQKRVRSKVGATLTLAIIAGCIFSFYLGLSNWANNSQLQIISSGRSFSVPQILNENLTFHYDLNYLNYNIYFALISNFKNQTLNHEQLKPYLTQKILYGPNSQEVPSEACNQAKQNAFLLNSKSNIEKDSKTTSIYTTCIKNPFEFGLYGSKTGVYNPTLSYYVYKCQNSTQNNNSCASDAEINNVLSSSYVQISLPKSIYDFTDPITPRKRTYDTQVYILDNSLLKFYKGNLLPIEVKTDEGLFTQDFKSDSLDFNIDGSIQAQFNIRKDGQQLFQYSLQLGFNTHTYYRKNSKILEILASLGGTVNIFMIIGKFLCFSYNSMIFKHKLINYAFENLDQKKSKKKPKFEESPTKSEDLNYSKSFKLSLRNLFCPSIFHNTVYRNAMKSINEYMDLDRIIKRLQDVDKLKLLLLDENQLKVFEMLPKPGIQGKRKPQNLKSFTLEAMISSMKETNKIIDYSFLLNGDKVNKKMLELMGPNFIEGCVMMTTLGNITDKKDRITESTRGQEIQLGTLEKINPLQQL